ncbi:hypothetical protein ACFVQB_14855 [Paenibacillus sp. NPDC057886]|uniref:hypothetical protein n=1 Tax=Paenibacillus sp. NPDC057886 TaxID=3346270 RepID=UPI0036BF14E6
MTNFNQMDMEYKLDYLSDLLVEQIFQFGDTYDSLSDAEKGSVKLGFHLDLADNNVDVTSELIEAVKEEFSSSPMADMLIEYIEINNTTEEVTTSHKEALSILTVGSKVTIVKFSEFGFPQMIHTVIESVKADKYAQYDDALYISHKPKRKRSVWTDIILPYQDVTVFNGWIDFDVDSLSTVTVKSDQFVTVKQSKYTSFDPRYMDDIKSSLSITPLLTIKSRKETVTC